MNTQGFISTRSRHLFHRLSGRPLAALGITALAVLLAPVGAAAAAPAPHTILVTTDDDNQTGGDGVCTLREAINNANAGSTDTTGGDCAVGTTSTDTIAFDPSKVEGVTLLQELPDITQPVVIDGSAISLGYTITGAPTMARGLSFAAGSKGSILRSIRLYNFNDGLDLTGGSVTVVGCSFGSGGSGDYVGILAASDANTIGLQGDTPNLFSGGYFAIVVTGSHNVIQNNYIGVDLTGEVATPNSSGVLLMGSKNLVGGPGRANNSELSTAANVISGNVAAGVVEEGSGSIIQGNLIGVDLGGSKAIPNGIGIEVGGVGALVGGLKALDGNVISGNTAAGISLDTTSSKVTIQGNIIGALPQSAASVGNAVGIDDKGSPNLVIGGAMPAGSNFIAWNPIGINVVGSATLGSPLTISGNIIGRRPSGDAAPNQVGVDFVLPNPGLKVTLSGNLLADNVEALAVTAGVVPTFTGAAGNCITGNAAGFTDNGGSLDISFAKNWWGSPSGPSGAYPGLGDSVELPSIAVAPWLTAPPAACLGWSPRKATPAGLHSFTNNLTKPYKLSWGTVPTAFGYEPVLGSHVSGATITDLAPVTLGKNSMTTQAPMEFGRYYWSVGVDAPWGFTWNLPKILDVTIQKSPAPDAVVKAGSVRLSWAAYAGASSYDVSWYPVPNCASGRTTIASIGGLTTTLAGMTSGSTISWQVRPTTSVVPMPCWSFTVK